MGKKLTEKDKENYKKQFEGIEKLEYEFKCNICGNITYSKKPVNECLNKCNER